MGQGFDQRQKTSFLNSFSQVFEHVSRGAGLTGFFSSLADTLIDSTRAKSPNPALSQADLRKLDWDTLHRTHTLSLNLGGLTLPSVKDAEIGTGRVISGSFVVSDPARLIRMLSSMTPPDVVDDKIRKGLGELVSSAASEIVTAASEDPSGYQSSFDTRWARQLLPQAERLDLPGAGGLRARLHALDNGYLSEQVAIERCRIYAAKGTFSPAEWHRDSTAGQYKQSWGDVLDVVKGLVESTNPSVRTLASAVIEKAREVATEAASDIQQHIANGTRLVEPAQVYLETLTLFGRGLSYYESSLKNS